MQRGMNIGTEYFGEDVLLGATTHPDGRGKF